jgi:hypothetical protein
LTARLRKATAFDDSEVLPIRAAVLRTIGQFLQLMHSSALLPIPVKGGLLSAAIAADIRPRPIPRRARLCAKFRPNASTALWTGRRCFAMMARQFPKRTDSAAHIIRH